MLICPTANGGAQKTEEGVVIEVVPKGREPRLVTTWFPDPGRFQRQRYVVQCRGWRALRYRTQLHVVAL